VLSGTVRLPATRYQIVRQGSAQVPELTGVRFKPPRGRPRVTGDAPPQSAAASFGDVRLDLNIVAPGQLFVSGMGLESEWRADMRVGGTSQARGSPAPSTWCAARSASPAARSSCRKAASASTAAAVRRHGRDARDRRRSRMST
jgi:hypothetical protein